MPEELHLKEELQLEINRLRQAFDQELQEKADLQIILETIMEHADAMDAELHQANQQLERELTERKQVEAELKASQANLRRILSVLNREKTDLEILTDILIDHGDFNDVQLRSEAKKTEQESQQRLSQFLEAVPVGIFVVDAGGRPYYANQMAQEILGQGVLPHVTPEQIPEMYQMFLAGTDEFYPHDQQPIVKALHGESSQVSNAEICRDGVPVPLEIWATPIFNADGEIVYAIAAFQDITERKQSEIDREQFIDDLFQLNVAGEKFVPRQFLNLLGYESIAEVALGDQVQQDMSVLFSDIRDFTALSEELTPAQSFEFNNSYLKCMDPVIERHHGFIDKYIGDAIMALFSGEADDAIKAGIGMLYELRAYNQCRSQLGCAPIEIGIGVNTGPLILGMVGGAHRMQGTVVSDTVNLAARVEDMTKDYKVDLIITQQTVDRLHRPEAYSLRQIARVKVRGRVEQVTLYEAFDADLPELRDKKLETAPLFQTALDCYHHHQIPAAIQNFQACLRQNPDDTIAHTYLNRCQTLLNPSTKGPPRPFPEN